MHEWICTYTGKAFWPLAPRPQDVCIEDIAHALSQKCRYTGHTRKFYSVAQHCVIASSYAARPHRLWVLMHDAAEAYLPDVAKPIKHKMAGFEEIEDALLEVIAEALELPTVTNEIAAEIKRIDVRMLITEKRDLMPPLPFPEPEFEGIEPFLAGIHPQTPKEAEHSFLSVWNYLRNS